MSVRVVVSASPGARAGEPLEIRTLIQHPMETGYRLDGAGKAIPRDILRRFTCHAGEQLLFSAELHAAIAANPYLAFWLRLPASTTLTLRWEGDRGFAHSHSLRVELA
jgi:sulfur-oxidizing protein SoxZ